MAISDTYRVGFVQPASRVKAQPWTEPWLRQAVARLQRQVANQPPDDCDRRVVGEIVRLGMQPDILAALRGRRDRQQAVRDLAVRYAFEAVMTNGRPVLDLDPLSQALIRCTLDLIRQRARQMEARVGENPLDEDAGLLVSICKSLSSYVPHKPMGAHITWKLHHYESAVSRAMRQIKHLVRLPQVTAPFVTYVLDAPVPDVLKAQLLQLARKGKLKGLDYEQVTRFFAHPATVAFVKRFAGTVQTARTLYAEDEYEGIAWQGRRRLPAVRRQGYLEAALAALSRLHDVSLDGSEEDADDGHDWYDVMSDAEAVSQAWSQVDLLHRESFEVWITRTALEVKPDHPLWQVAELFYVQRLTSDEIVGQGLADRETLAAVLDQMDALQADTDVWRLWMETTMG